MDYGIAYTDKQAKVLEKHIRSIYTEAKKDINGKLKDFNARFKVKDAKHKADLKAGLITKEEYQSWLKGQVFQGDHWKQMRAQMESILTHANEEAINIVNGGKISVIANNANYMAYTLEHGAGVNFGFALYDRSTVTNLLKEQPDLLPNKHVDPVKDGAWNRKKITRQVTLGILEGESTDQVADRLANVLSAQDQNAMLTTARTAMTSAQNAGRQLRMEEAAKKGIKLHKEWMCTLDLHTRTAHRELDGQKVPVDKPFKVDGYEIRFPADPEAHPSLTYNCRCTMVADLDDYPSVYQRYDNIDGVPVDQMTYKEWAKAKGFVETLAAGIDYSKFGGKNVYDIIKKYNSWDEFEDLSDYDSEWKPVTDAFEAYDPNTTWEDIYGEWKKEIDELESGAIKQTVKDAIDYSEFGGKKFYDALVNTTSYDEFLGSLDWDELDYFIKSSPSGEALEDTYKKWKLKAVGKEKEVITNAAIDYSEFGGEETYEIFKKYKDMTDWMLNAPTDEQLAIMSVSSDTNKLKELFAKVHANDKKESVEKVVNGISQTDIDKIVSKYDSYLDLMNDDADWNKFYNFYHNELGGEYEEWKKTFESIKNGTLNAKTLDANDKGTQKAIKTTVTAEGSDVIVKYDKDAWLDMLSKNDLDKMDRWTDDFVSSITADEKAGVRTYTGSAYTRMNEYLRGIDKHPAPYTIKDCEDCASALQKASLPEDVIVRRGSTKNSFERMIGQKGALDRIDEGDTDFVVGLIANDKGFLSTSPSPYGGFGGDVEYVMFLPKGTHAMYVDKISKNRGEQEILLQKDSSFIVEAVEKIGSGWNEHYRVFMSLIL